MKIPTVNDYQELYDEFKAHCEFFSGTRTPFAEPVCNKMLTFAEEYKDFLKRCFEGTIIDKYSWLIYAVTLKEIETPGEDYRSGLAYHTDDIRRIAEELYIICEDGINAQDYHENPERDRLRALKREREFWGE